MVATVPACRGSVAMVVDGVAEGVRCVVMVATVPACRGSVAMVVDGVAEGVRCVAMVSEPDRCLPIDPKPVTFVPLALALDAVVTVRGYNNLKFSDAHDIVLWFPIVETDKSDVAIGVPDNPENNDGSVGVSTVTGSVEFDDEFAVNAKGPTIGPREGASLV